MSFTSFLGDRGSAHASSNHSQSSFQDNSFSQSTPSTSFSSSPSSSSSTTDAFASPTAESLFTNSITHKELHPFAGLGTNEQMDYLLLEEDKTNMEGSILGSRGFLDDVQTGAGTAYVTGLFAGGALGAFDGLRKPGKMGGKLRWNAMLNAGSMRGTYYANTAGTLAIFYNILNNTVYKFSPPNTSDQVTSIISGALSGALYKSTSGLRPALAGAGVMAVGAAAWNGFKAYVF
ncbi:Mitochondrial import inner membrane translocase, subunit TIM23 [Phaffia rhodozyma]|uniref:Mitochondrial import inner membrane translocase, subunit TIM23 n=1 Tax=Phaffia rhodozyma TaxID=264483 RepID=A0A0F7SEQ7_PHARH|nr:Mitochondrial import inner membrane translocase, subunit TIM23 [Phaffia rhodozyma]